MPAVETLCPQLLRPGAVLLRGHLVDAVPMLLAAIDRVAAAAPFRHMTTPGGFRMSVAMTNCGQVGWVTDRRGYRYTPGDPQSASAWPPMPPLFSDVATQAAARAGYPGFAPDACLINLYRPGARMSLHQDRNEQDDAAPIVSVSLGLPAVFLFGGAERGQRPLRIALHSGDVVVWGGAARKFFHGVGPVADGDHPLTGRIRFNLTFRKAL